MRSRNPYTLRKLNEVRNLSPHSGPLASVNVGFHETYTRLVDETLVELGDRLPVLVLIGDDLTLLCDGQVQHEQVIPARYHDLKALAHIAFSVQLTLMGNGTGLLADATASELQAKRSQILEAQAAANTLGNEVASPAPAALLKEALALVDRVLASKNVDFTELGGGIRALASLALELGRLAVQIELERLNSLVTGLRGQIGPSRWTDAYVVICGNHQPRYREAASQYFARLLAEHEGHAAEREERLLYGEGLGDVDAALDLLARHIIDQRASRLLFGDRRHLQRDLLADAATAQLSKLFPPANR